MNEMILKQLKVISASIGLMFLLSANAYSEINQQTLKFEQYYRLAQFSNAAYMSKIEIVDIISKSGYVLNEAGQLSGYGVAYFMASNHQTKEHIISVRGTSNIENALVDAAIELLPDKHSGVRLHQGFAKSAEQVYAKVKSSVNKEYKIHTTGHSLGGAVAVILAMYLDKDGYTTGQVITLGQPKVTNVQGSQMYQHLNVTRLVMPKDIVPLLPPFDPMSFSVDDLSKINVYWHIGSEVILLSENQYSVLEGVQSMMRITDFLDKTPTEENLLHHTMVQYLKVLDKKLTKPVKVDYKASFNLMKLLGF